LGSHVLEGPALLHLMLWVTTISELHKKMYVQRSAMMATITSSMLATKVTLLMETDALLRAKLKLAGIAVMEAIDNQTFAGP
jgi:hypothetical protein